MISMISHASLIQIGNQIVLKWEALVSIVFSLDIVLFLENLVSKNLCQGHLLNPNSLTIGTI